MGRICAAPGCSSGTNADRRRREKLGLRQVSIFKVPKDLKSRHEWETILGKLTASDLICSAHFDPNDVIKDDIVNLSDGTRHVSCRKKYKLSAGAVPTQLVARPEEKENEHQNIELVQMLDDHAYRSSQDDDNTSTAFDESEDDEQVGVENEEEVVSDSNTQATQDTLGEDLLSVESAMEQLKTHQFPESWCWMKNDDKSIFFILFDKIPTKPVPRLRLELRNDSTLWIRVHNNKKILLKEEICSLTEVIRKCEAVVSYNICSDTGKNIFSDTDRTDEDSSEPRQTNQRRKRCRIVLQKTLPAILKKKTKSDIVFKDIRNKLHQKLKPLEKV